MKYISDFKHEQEILKQMLTKINDKIVHLRKKSEESAEYLERMYHTYTPETQEFYSEIPVAEHINDIYKRDLEGMIKIADNPYFGKLIFTFDRSVSDNIVYLGKKGLDDDIIDWRTPVADVYYSGKMGKTSYHAPQGETHIDLKLKATLKIRDRELLSIYDSETVVNDDLLSEYLSQNKGTVLNEIIATIQSEQNSIIRKNLYTNLIVQGVAGSGKTTVALHRISYLLYNFKDLITFENIYLIAGNRLFLNYITAMLPDLDIPVIKQGIMQDILTEAIKEYRKSFKPQKIITATKETAQIYNNHNFIDNFENHLKVLEDDIFGIESLKIFRFEILSEEQITYYKNRKELSLGDRAKILDGYISTRLKNNKASIITFLSDNKREDEVIEFTQQYFGLDRNSIYEMYLEKKYSKFAGTFSKYFSKKIDKIKCEERYAAFTGHSSKEYTINDLACLLLFYLRIKGNITENKIRHVVIDEAQDFGSAVYYCLKNLFSEANFTIVGDIMQNINEGGLDDWKTLKERVFTENVVFEKLLKSYRNTIEISTFAEKVMRYLGKSDFTVEPLVRHGQEVRFIDYLSYNNKVWKLCDMLENMKSQEDIPELTAVICKENETAEKLYRSLYKAGKQIDAALLNTKDEALRHGVYIMSVRNSKGLEFDNVFVWDFDDYIEDNSQLSRNCLYVALTRALHKLYIFSVDKETFRTYYI